MKPYPQTVTNIIDNHTEILKQVTRLRKEDAADYDNLDQRFMAGRKVGKIPASSADVAVPEDRVGDFNYDTSYLYVLVDNAGTAEWRRAALASW